jgi:hypothetical protein
MQYLPLPVKPEDDEAVVKKLGEDPAWTPHEAKWIAAYKTYQASKGSPFIVTAHDFGPGIGELQYKLYDTRKGSGVLLRMRRKANLKSCPVCGSPVTGSLDHYLPRALYREFSIMRANLVPACMHCNSSSKGSTVHGGDPKRFIHPYFDNWAANVLWYVEIIPPYRAATFAPRPMPGLPAPRDEIVAFHLWNVLGTQFKLSMETAWSSLPDYRERYRSTRAGTAGRGAGRRCKLLAGCAASGRLAQPRSHRACAVASRGGADAANANANAAGRGLTEIVGLVETGSRRSASIQ